MTVMGYLCHKWPRYVPLAVNTSQSFLHSWRINEFATRLTRRVPLVEQELFRSTKFTPSFSGIRLNRSLFLCGRFVDCCMSFCTFSFGHCVVCSSSIYGFWLPLWYLLAIVLSVLLRFTDSDYPCGIFILFQKRYTSMNISHVHLQVQDNLWNRLMNNKMLGSLFSLWMQSINPYLLHTPFTELSVLLQYAVTKITWLV
jgi:hypothetical protein